MSDGETFSWPISTVSNSIGSALTINSVENYRWMVIVGGILAFAMAWGIGANDVANAFATSVGAGSISLPVACLIAAVMEFGGALLLGGQVTDTVRKKMINVDIFDPNSATGAANGPEMLMTGFLVSLFSATIWLVMATFLALPVSTTHSIIGSIVGVGLAYRGGSAVVWIPEDTNGLANLKGVVGVIVSWVVSPVLSGIIAVIVFLLVRTLILRNKEPYRAGVLFMPILFGVTIAMAIFFIIYKGDKRFKISDKVGVGGSVGIALGAGAVVALFSWFFIVPLAKNAVERWEARQIDMSKDVEAARAREEKSKQMNQALSKVGINLTIDEELSDDVVRIHENVEKFDIKTERLFTWVQVFTAAIDAFAHGANDVANSIAPFSSIFQLHRNSGVISTRKTSKFEKDGTFSAGSLDGQSFEDGDKIPDGKSYCGTVNKEKYFACKSSDDLVFPALTPEQSGAESQEFSLYDEDGVFTKTQVCYTACSDRNYAKYGSFKQDVELWILAMGGVGIVVGLAMWGYRIIQAIGVKLTKLTPSRGFSIEIGAAITVLIASEIGIPVSTTHCQVGATMGVGLVEVKASTVNWKQFFFICVGWVFTVLFTGFLAAMLFLVITRSPMNIPVPQGEVNDDLLKFCPGNRFFVYDSTTTSFRGVGCSGTAK